MLEMTTTPSEMMAAVAARELANGEVVFVGIGLPNLACNLARALQAPDLVLIYESGAVGAVPERLPVSIGDPSLVTGSLMVCSMADVFQLFLQNGKIEVGFLGGAQVDRWGNINTTVIGTYQKPEGPAARLGRRRGNRDSRPAGADHQPALHPRLPRRAGLSSPAPASAARASRARSSGCRAPARSR